MCFHPKRRYPIFTKTQLIGAYGTQWVPCSFEVWCCYKACSLPQVKQVQTHKISTHPHTVVVRWVVLFSTPVWLINCLQSRQCSCSVQTVFRQCSGSVKAVFRQCSSSYRANPHLLTQKISAHPTQW